MTARPDDVIDVDAIGADDLTALLRAAGACTGAVASIARSPVGVGVGLIARLARLRLEWTGGAGPASVVVKYSAAAGASRATGAALRMYERETAFYATHAASLGAVVPACYAAAFDATSHDHTILMEDLGDRRFADSVAGVSPDDAHVVVRAIAALHARTWDRADAESTVFPRVDDGALMAIWTTHYPQWWTVADEVCRDFAPAVRHVLATLPERLPRLAASLAEGPLALGHGDVRADNLAFARDRAGERPLVLVDWQFVDRARPGRDLGYFLTQSMAPADRRAHFDELVDAYLLALAGAGVTLDRERLVGELRAGALLAMTYAVGAVGAVDRSSARARDVGVAHCTRCAAAIEDLDLAEL